MSDNRPTLCLIDGHAVAYRQYHALMRTNMSTKAGEVVFAVYGFTRTLLDVLQKTKPDYLIVTFDKGLSGRDKVYSEYKATRDKMPDDLRSQLGRINEVVQAFNIPILAKEGYEADDVIGTIAAQAAAQGVDVRIITGDKDLLQLLNDHVTVQLPVRKGPDELYDVAKFIEKYNVRPDQWIDVKALMGDSSDNIPGVKGIGEKTAAKLLQTYETLDGVYANLEAIKGANGRKLSEGRDSAYMSQDLVTIQTDVPVSLDLKACVSHEYDPNVPDALFRELEFRAFRDRIRVDAPVEAVGTIKNAEDVVKTVIVRDEAALNALVETLNQAAAITWDVETTSVDQMQAKLVGISLAVDDETGYYVPVGHIAEGAGTLFEQPVVDQLPLEVVIEALREPLTNPHIPKIAHNAAYDLVVMTRYGIEVTPIGFDTMVGEWLRDPASKFLGLKNLADHELQVHMTPISELIGKGKKQIAMDTVSIDRAAPYAAADAVMTHRLVKPLRADLQEKGLTELLERLELPLVPVIAAMEQVGVALDASFLAEMSNKLAGNLAQLEKEIYGLSGGYGNFNISSPKQLNDVLFGKLGLPVDGLKKTTHGYSTNFTTLEKLKADTGHPILIHILKHRELTKLKGTYVDALPNLVNPHTGRVHTSYNQTGTTTGRLSSSNPNLQNIPMRTELGREVRRAFVAPSGSLLLAVDYSQIELRVLAHISQDKTLLQAFSEGQDIHAATAAAVNGIALDEVTYEQRSFAKRVNFGLIYGMGAFRLSRDSDLTLQEAQRFVKTYFERLPRVNQYIEETKQLAAKDGYLTTLFGRKRFFPTLKNARANRQVIQAEERAAINMPIQGTAADIMKQAMLDVHNALAQSSLNAKMMLQVHDELVLEVPEAELAETSDLVVQVMENAYTMDAPLKANAEVGPNWREMEAL
jgi:DNA polymerase I